MDFGTLLHTAQKNDKNKKEIRYYSTKFEPPKKEQRSKQLSENIKRFLAKQKEDEAKKAEVVQKKKDDLLALRAQDKKATRRVNVMLKRTKSANQSVIQDAVDKDNTAVTLAGPVQPDEDDYGYVSQEASAFYNKMMEKYSKMPDEPKFNFAKKKVSSNLNSTKDRVKAALDRERDEALMPHRRKRKHVETCDSRDDVEPEEPKFKQPSLPKPKPKNAPPPMNFADLLKIAEKKQFEPIVIEKPKTKEEEKLLTKKQKKEMEREREWKERREGKISSVVPPEKIISASNNRIPKINDERKATNTDRLKMSGDKSKIPINSTSTTKQSSSNVRNGSANSSVRPSEIKSLSMKNGSVSGLNKPSDLGQKKVQVRANYEITRGPIVNKTGSGGGSSSSSSNTKNYTPSSRPPAGSALQNKFSTTNKIDQYRKEATTRPLGVNNGKPKEFPPRDLKQQIATSSDSNRNLQPKQFPPKDMKPKQFPPHDVRRAGGESLKKDLKRKPQLNRRRQIIDDDDSEYDSEMDDFIDDGPEGQEDYSKYISEIFGYDKKRYRDIDDDVDNMESTFAQQMREEVISTKIGIMEDLEDMKKEEEHNKRKALMKKKMK